MQGEFSMLGVQQPVSKIREISNKYPQNFKKRVWKTSSWQNFVAMQQPVYTDKNLLESCLQQLKRAPALVQSNQIEQLKKHIALAGKGQQFLLQAGDCAEQFKDCQSQIVMNKLSSILQIKTLIEQDLQKVVIPIGRIAGQYAKPRSNEHETQNGVTLPSFKGDIIHSSEFSVDARKTNPQRLLTAYEKSAQTLNYIQNSQTSSSFFTSHEALLLCYESALTRYHLQNSGFYNTSAHLLWLGERTRSLQGAHVEYLKGIKNPIGIKLSHKITEEELVELVSTLNPSQEEGKIILIHRLGSEHVGSHLPRLIAAVKEANLFVTWMCDPMHGNGEVVSNGIKTRRFENILTELIHSVQIHKNQGTILGGVHLETAEENVTECLGGKQKIASHDLEKNYQSACDPRLNPLQSAELSSYLTKEMSRAY